MFYEISRTTLNEMNFIEFNENYESLFVEIDRTKLIREKKKYCYCCNISTTDAEIYHFIDIMRDMIKKLLVAPFTNMV